MRNGVLCDSFFDDKHVCAKHDCATVFSTTSTFVRQFFVRQLFCATAFLCERGAAPRTTVNKFLRLFITVNVDETPVDVDETPVYKLELRACR